MIWLLAGCLILVATLLRIAFGQLWKRSSKPPRAGRSLRCVLTGDRDDRDYDLLWRTQLPALEALRSAGSGGVAIARMVQFYRDLARVYPELFDGSSFSDWLDALQSAEVVVYCKTGATLILAENGRLILDSLERKVCHGR